MSSSQSIWFPLKLVTVGDLLLGVFLSLLLELFGKGGTHTGGEGSEQIKSWMLSTQRMCHFGNAYMVGLVLS